MAADQQYIEALSPLRVVYLDKSAEVLPFDLFPSRAVEIWKPNERCSLDARVLGKTFAKLKGRRLQEDGLRIEQLEMRKHNASVWQVVRDE